MEKNNNKFQSLPRNPVRRLLGKLFGIYKDDIDHGKQVYRRGYKVPSYTKAKNWYKPASKLNEDKGEENSETINSYYTSGHKRDVMKAALGRIGDIAKNVSTFGIYSIINYFRKKRATKDFDSTLPNYVSRDTVFDDRTSINGYIFDSKDTLTQEDFSNTLPHETGSSLREKFSEYRNRSDEFNSQITNGDDNNYKTNTQPELGD